MRQQSKRFITVREIVTETGLPRKHVYRLIHSGLLPGGYKLTTGNCGLRVDRTVYETWLASKRITFRGRKLADD